MPSDCKIRLSRDMPLVFFFFLPDVSLVGRGFPASRTATLRFFEYNRESRNLVAEVADG